MTRSIPWSPSASGRSTLRRALLLLCCGVAPAIGQIRGPDDAFDSRRLDEVEAPDRKSPSIWRRPAQPTPEEQLEHALVLEERGRRRAARRAYDALVHRWHASAEAATAQLAVARLYESSGRHLRAFREYQYAARHFSGQVAYRELLQRQFALANALRADLRRGWLGFGREANADQVVSLFRGIARNAPSWERAPECYLLMGRTFEDEGRFDEALLPYETLVTRYPGHALSEQAMFGIAHSRYRLALRSPRDERTLRHALSMLASTLRDHPGHPQREDLAAWSRELQGRLVRMALERAEFYDRIRGLPRAAIVAYQEFLRQFPEGPEAARARARIAELLEAHPEYAQSAAGQRNADTGEHR